MLMDIRHKQTILTRIFPACFRHWLSLLDWCAIIPSLTPSHPCPTGILNLLGHVMLTLEWFAKRSWFYSISTRTEDQRIHYANEEPPIVDSFIQTKQHGPLHKFQKTTSHPTVTEGQTMAMGGGIIMTTTIMIGLLHHHHAKPLQRWLRVLRGSKRGTGKRFQITLQVRRVCATNTCWKLIDAFLFTAFFFPWPSRLSSLSTTISIVFQA